MDLTQFMFDTRVEFPGFQVRKKSESGFMKLLEKLLLLVTFGQQKTFMTNYTTTINTTVYVPSGWETWTDLRKLAILRHERVHMRQAAKYSFPVFMLLYLLVPIPLFFAYYRAKFEWEAYTESMRCVVETNGIAVLDDEKYKKSITDQFTTGAYGWMMPFPAMLDAWWAESKSIIEAERAGR